MPLLGTVDGRFAVTMVHAIPFQNYHILTGPFGIHIRQSSKYRGQFSRETDDSPSLLRATIDIATKIESKGGGKVDLNQSWWPQASQSAAWGTRVIANEDLSSDIS